MKDAFGRVRPPGERTRTLRVSPRAVHVPTYLLTSRLTCGTRSAQYLELPPEELARVALQDVRCVKFVAGQEVPWHRDDPRSHFVVVVLLSEPSRGESLEGGTLCVHGGTCKDDSDAHPVHMSQGDALIYCAPRLDHAVRRVDEGERLVAMFEFAYQ